jgi:hypothetical protein
MVQYFPDDAASVFRHMDWYQSNIILHRNLDKIAAMIDWGMPVTHLIHAICMAMMCQLRDGADRSGQTFSLDSSSIDKRRLNYESESWILPDEISAGSYMTCI